MHVLQVLLAERSVSRTAMLLGQSQPAISVALKRLRDILGDPLLVRSGSTLVPTERGREIGDRIARVLSEIDGLVKNEEAFDPVTDARLIRIHSMNCLGTYFVPRIASALRREAPLMQVDFCATPDERDILLEMETGEIDLTIGNWPTPRDTLRIAHLLDTDMVLLMRRDNPLSTRGRLTLEEYLTIEHLSPTPHVSSGISPVDGRLAQLGKKRRIAVTVPEFALVPQVLERTDLVFTSSRAFAQEVAAPSRLVIVGAPVELGSMKFSMLWHERAHHSPCNRWIRGIVRQVFQDLGDHEAAQSSKRASADIIVAQ